MAINSIQNEEYTTASYLAKKLNEKRLKMYCTFTGHRWKLIHENTAGTILWFKCIKCSKRDVIDGS